MACTEKRRGMAAQIGKEQTTPTEGRRRCHGCRRKRGHRNRTMHGPWPVGTGGRVNKSLVKKSSVGRLADTGLKAGTRKISRKTSYGPTVRLISTIRFKDSSHPMVLMQDG